MKTIVSILGCAALVGCIAPFGGGRGTLHSEALAHGGPSDGVDTVPAPIVQVRSFPQSSTISVLAWDADEAGFGLRTEIRRHGGTIVGANDRTEHRLYVSPEFVMGMGGFAIATLGPVPGGTVLMRTGVRADDNACNRTRTCSPMHALGVVLPDTLLRSRRDSLVVSFSGPAVHDWTLSFRPELVTAYLRAVDSVSASLRRTR